MAIGADTPVIIYGSQTGQSQAIAEEVQTRLSTAGINAELYCMDQINKGFELERTKLAVFICSSTGDGDHPDNAAKFFKYLNQTDHKGDHLAHLKFCLLGLGDTNYNTFGACPKRLEKRLLELGAVKMFKSGLCDDAVGLELVAEPWMNELVSLLSSDSKSPANVASLTDQLSQLKPFQPSDESMKSTSTVNGCLSGGCSCTWPTDSLKHSSRFDQLTDLKIPIAAVPWLQLKIVDDSEKEVNSTQSLDEFPSMGSQIVDATVVGVELLTTDNPAKVKPKYEIRLNLENKSIEFEPGDAFYVLCQNRDWEVQMLLERLGTRPELWTKRLSFQTSSADGKSAKTIPIHLQHKTSLFDLFRSYVDIRKCPSKPLLRIMAEFAEGPDKVRLLQLCSSEGAAEFIQYIRQPQLSLLDVLHAFPSCSPPLTRILEFLPRLLPRAYSVANSPLSPDISLKFAFTLVEFLQGDGRFFKRYGLCTSYLSSLNTGDTVKLFLKKRGARPFSMPSDDCPMIMVGPGTGVAPFLGFLDHIRLSEVTPKSGAAVKMLFYGCRYMNEDFIYKNELKQHVADGTLTSLSVACSREFEQLGTGRYVQDEILKKGSCVANLLTLSHNLVVYVCGDAKHMANDVFAAFAKVLVENKGMSMAEALKFLTDMKEAGRYLQDIWA